MAIRGGKPPIHRPVPHIFVRGLARAVDFYERALGAKVGYRSAIPGFPVLHAQLMIGDSAILVSEENMGMDEETASRYEAGTARIRSPQTLGGTSCIIEIYVGDVDAAFRRAIEAGGVPKVPVSNAFFGDRYGQFTDPFGHVWALATVLETLSPEQVDQRAMREFAQPQGNAR
jgi:PhnB protein